jgi:predicted nucleotidyltransferase
MLAIRGNYPKLAIMPRYSDQSEGRACSTQHEMMRPPSALTIRRVFTPPYRTRLREELVAAARADERITGVAVTGSFAVGNEDAWSDVDLAFGIGEPMAMHAVMDDLTARMYGEHGAVHHVDVVAGASIYRVFMLANTLQVDLAFSPASEFGAIAPSFRLLFGTAVERPPVVAPPPSSQSATPGSTPFTLGPAFNVEGYGRVST